MTKPVGPKPPCFCRVTWVALNAMLVCQVAATSEGSRIFESCKIQPLENDPAGLKDRQIKNLKTSDGFNFHGCNLNGSQTETASEDVPFESGPKRQKLLDGKQHKVTNVPQSSSEFAPRMQTDTSPWGFGFSLVQRPADRRVTFKHRGVPTAADMENSHFQRAFLERSEMFMNVVFSELESYKKTHCKKLKNNISPSAAFLAIVLSQRLSMSSKLDCATWRKKKMTESWKLICWPHELFIPIAYQLIIMKVSPSEWEHFEVILANFFSDWTLIILYEQSLDYERMEAFEGMIAEKSAKMVQWISEMLINSFVPDVYEEFQKEDLKVGQVGRGKATGCNVHPVTGILKLQRKSNSRGHTRSHAFKRLLETLIIAWQKDCHNGYPEREEKKMGDWYVKKSSGEYYHESKKRAWNNWCNSIVSIEKSAAKITGQFTAYNGWDNLYFKTTTSLLDWYQRMSERDYKGCSISRGEVKRLWSLNFRVPITDELVDQLLIRTIDIKMKPIIVPSDILLKITFLLSPKSSWSISEQYLMDKIEMFFNLDRILGKNLSHFDLEFKANKKRLEFCARDAKKRYYCPKSGNQKT